MLPYLCDTLGLAPEEVTGLGAEGVAAFTCYHEGKGLAEWANQTDKPDGHGRD